MTEQEGLDYIKKGLGAIYEASMLFVQIVGMDRARDLGIVDEETETSVNEQYAAALKKVSEEVLVPVEDAHDIIMFDYCRLTGILGTDEEKEIREKYSLKPQQQD